MTHRDAGRGSTGALAWHRSHRRLLEDDGYWNLPAGPRALYAGIALLALNERGTVEYSTRKLSRRLNLRVTEQQVESLVQAGLIGICASREQAKSWHAASVRVTRDRYRDRDRPRDVNQGSKQRPETDIEPSTTDNGTEPSSEPHITALSRERREIPF
jgi:hypothetical protein